MSMIKRGIENSSLKQVFRLALWNWILFSPLQGYAGPSAQRMKDTSPVLDIGFSGFLGRRVGNTPARSQPHPQSEKEPLPQHRH